MTTDRDREAFEAWFKTADRAVLDRYWAEEAWDAALAHAREAGAQEPVAVPADQLFLVDTDHAVCFAPSGRFHGWLFKRHPDGQFVSVRKLDVTSPYPADHPLAALFGTPPATPVSPAADSGKSRLREAVRKAIAVAGEDHTGCNPQMVAKRISDLLKDALASTPAPQFTPVVYVNFTCQDGPVSGLTSAPVKSVTVNDDGSLRVDLDYWPAPQPAEQRRVQDAAPARPGLDALIAEAKAQAPQPGGAPGYKIGAANRAAVRALMASHLGITRVEISKRLGLGVMAVTRHVAKIRAEWGGQKLPTRRGHPLPTPPERKG